MSQASQSLRKLTVTEAVFIGLASMIEVGVFAIFGPAVQAAGNGLLIGLGIAFVIAFCNAFASAQLATVYPTSDGTGRVWGWAGGSIRGETGQAD